MKTKLITALAVGAACALIAPGCGKGRTQTWEREPAVAASSTPASENPTEAGDELWAQRDDKAQLEKAIEAWESALAADPNNLDLLVRLARGTYFLADAYLRGDQDAYLSTFERGVDYAERALVAASPEFARRVKGGETVMQAVEAVGPEGIAALYWYSSNLGKWAKAKGFATTLGNKDTIKATMDRCLALDESFFFGGPHRYFGAYYSVAPAFAGGDLDKSQQHFEKSLELYPNYVGTKVLMAENYAVKRQDKDLFRKLLEEVIAAPDDVIPDLVPETKAEKVKAQELLAQIDDKF